MSHFGNVTKFDTVLAAASAMTVDGTFFGDPASSIYNAADKPPNTTDVQYLVMIDGTYGRRVVLAIGYAVTDEWRYFGTRDILNGEWLNDWRKVSVSAPPQEYSLSLAEDIIVYPGFQATYHRNQFGEVTVILTVKKQDNSPITYGEVIATLPSGYRPSAIIAVSAEGQVQTGVFGSNLTIQVYPDGRIVFYTSGGLGAIDPVSYTHLTLPTT